MLEQTQKNVHDSAYLFLGDIDSFKEHSFCNFEYLLAKMHAMRSVHGVMGELELTLGRVLDPELHVTLRCLEGALPALCRDPLQLANELIGRLRPIKGKEMYRL